VRGITIDNLAIGVKKADVRVPIWLDDVIGLRIHNSRLFGPLLAKAFVSSNSIKDFDIAVPIGWCGEPGNIILEK